VHIAVLLERVHELEARVAKDSHYSGKPSPRDASSTFENDVDHCRRRCHAWHVVERLGVSARAHPFRHEALRLRRDHPVTLGNEKPRR
jgi:hypothetical protein